MSRMSWSKIKGKSADERVVKRRERLEKLVGKRLMNIGEFSLESKKIEGRNLENMIGAIQVPVGVAGPLRLTKDYYLPLATTEGALVASVNRGCRVISESGGVEVVVENVGATRGPVFRVKNLREGQKLIVWLRQNFDQLKKRAEKTDKYLKLLKMRPKLLGRNVYVRFEFDTSEAMGMNMVTAATKTMVEWIEKNLRIECVALSGNFCVDKKPSWLNMTNGRGKQVWAEVVVSKKVVKQVLKTTPEKIVEVVYRKQLLGSAISGSMGFNGHYANIVAAMFLATGQDVAHVVEGSLGITTAEIVGNDLYFSVYLPDLMVGTVGGGTGLETQKEALEILGLGDFKRGDSERLAEIIGGAVLAGELSLTAALASKDLARAHQKLGRGK